MARNIERRIIPEYSDRQSSPDKHHRKNLEGILTSLRCTHQLYLLRCRHVFSNSFCVLNRQKNQVEQLVYGGGQKQQQHTLLRRSWEKGSVSSAVVWRTKKLDSKYYINRRLISSFFFTSSSQIIVRLDRLTTIDRRIS